MSYASHDGPVEIEKGFEGKVTLIQLLAGIASGERNENSYEV